MIEPEFFPGNDPLLVSLWEQRIRPMIYRINQEKLAVDATQPPTKAEIKEFLATSDDPACHTLAEQLRDLHKETKALEKKIEQRAISQLRPDSNEDARKDARSAFNATKRELISSLQALASIAGHNEEPQVIAWVENTISQIPKLNTTSNDSNLRPMRDWLRLHHPEAGIKERGVIPVKWQQVYYSRLESQPADSLFE